MTQNQKVLRHMQVYGKITTFEAFTNYHITRLSARIWELRHQQGYAIDGKDKVGVNSFGERVKYTEYRLVG